MESGLVFGKFIETKRLEKGISLRGMAEQMKVSAPYLSDVEKGRKNPPAYDKLESIARILALSEEDKNTMFELATKRGDGKEIVVPDVAAYIMENDFLVAALREARDMDATKDEWEQMLEELRNRRKG